VKVDFHSQATAEFNDAIDYYNLRKAHLGREFAGEVRAAIQRIQDFPNGWALVDEDEGIRRCQTHRFPCGVIYQVQSDRILIIAVAHLHRRPNYWHGRT
jgi:plasmid stabilization system protein ParE